MGLLCMLEMDGEQRGANQPRQAVWPRIRDLVTHLDIVCSSGGSGSRVYERLQAESVRGELSLGWLIS